MERTDHALQKEEQAPAEDAGTPANGQGGVAQCPPPGQEIMQIMLDVSDDVVYVNTLDDYTIRFVNRALAATLDATVEELLGKKCWQTFQTGQSGPCPFCPISKIKAPGGAERSEVYTWETVNPVTGRTYLARDSIVRWVDGTYVHVEAATDITGQKENELRLKRLASTDSMTGASNRAWGAQALEAMLQADEAGGSLVFMDLDGLKKINDQLGHTHGDDFIMGVVEAVHAELQPAELFCRWGGDEFLLWLNVPEADAHARVARIQAALRDAERHGKRPFNLAFSYGVVPFGAGRTLDALVSEADKRMYKDKLFKRGISMNRRREDRD